MEQRPPPIRTNDAHSSNTNDLCYMKHTITTRMNNKMRTHTPPRIYYRIRLYKPHISRMLTPTPEAIVLSNTLNSVPKDYWDLTICYTRKSSEISNYRLHIDSSTNGSVQNHHGNLLSHGKSLPTTFLSIICDKNRGDFFFTEEVTSISSATLLLHIKHSIGYILPDNHQQINHTVQQLNGIGLLQLFKKRDTHLRHDQHIIQRSTNRDYQNWKHIRFVMHFYF